MPLPSASVFDRQGKALGITATNGRLPNIGSEAYPLTIRYLGYAEKTVPAQRADTIFLTPVYSELQELVVESKQHRLLHMLAYVREYSTLTKYNSDTVFLFREKMVDYMLNPGNKVKFSAWARPRVLKSKSYYRFSDSSGIDSVSDVSQLHFSWSDWMGLAPTVALPERLAELEIGSDTVRGKYSPAEIWARRNGRIVVDVNVLADTSSRKWVPNLSAFFKDDLDFEQFRVRFNFDDALTGCVSPEYLKAYSYNIESQGRGLEMFWFNRDDEPFFVSTFAEVYILDREYITVREAKKWDSRRFDTSEIEILYPDDVPGLQPAILSLIGRVEAIDREKIRLDVEPDHRLAGPHAGSSRFGIGYRALDMLKCLTGISRIKAARKEKKMWREFRDKQREKNRQHISPELIGQD